MITIYPLYHCYVYDQYISSPSSLYMINIYISSPSSLHHAIYDQYISSLSLLYIWSICLLPIIAIYDQHIYILSIIAIKQLNSWSSTPDGWWTCPTHDEQMDSACSLHAGWSCKAQIQGNEHLPS
jgi:hypothetical protein